MESTIQCPCCGIFCLLAERCFRCSLSSTRICPPCRLAILLNPPPISPSSGFIQTENGRNVSYSTRRTLSSCRPQIQWLPRWRKLRRRKAPSRSSFQSVSRETLSRNCGPVRTGRATPNQGEDAGQSPRTTSLHHQSSLLSSRVSGFSARIFGSTAERNPV